MSKLKYLSGVVMAFLVGTPTGASAVTSANRDPAKPAPDAALSQAARETVAQRVAPSRITGNKGASKFSFARESGPSWVNSPRKIDRLDKIKTLPQMNQRIR